MSTQPTPPIDWTPGRMAFQLPDALEAYVLAHSTGYRRRAATLADETAALGEPAVMMLAKEQYALFRFLCARCCGCRNALDVGTFTGMSALAFAEGMGPGGRVSPSIARRHGTEIARRHWTAAGVEDRIEVRLGEASDVLRDLATTHAGLFDIAFLDVDKARVEEYFDADADAARTRGPRDGRQRVVAWLGARRDARSTPTPKACAASTIASRATRASRWCSCRSATGCR